MLAPRNDSKLTRLLEATAPVPTLRQLTGTGLDQLPLPGSGDTLERWQTLARVASRDLSLVKLFEGHTDAIAILTELGFPSIPPDSQWGTWCAEPPDARVALHVNGGLDTAALTGTKAWCSGAQVVTHAVVSCWDKNNQPCLAAVALDQSGVTVTRAGWQAVGMADTQSVDVHFENAVATRVGGPGDYVNRPGFWQGGAGIAACWYGGALGIASMTRQLAGPKPDAHRLAHLGAIDVALSGAAAVLRETAAWIDQHPQHDAQIPALRARMVVEHAAMQVLLHAGRALGAAPFCRNARFARAMADLPVFLRQSHAERDLAALGERILASNDSLAPAPSWML
jgi:hypothetical protein